ncbi:hypothetical protein CGH84_01755, partial [Vibrio parahaemolyticus]|uniref:hypothetical protein n=2 Tax=Vibrio TaxID=662 RepID=UPI0011736CDF
MLIGAIDNDDSGFVKNIWEFAIDNAKPNLFSKLPHIDSMQLTDELKEWLDNQQIMRYDLTEDEITFDINGFTTSLSVYDDGYKDKLGKLLEKKPSNVQEFLDI